ERHIPPQTQISPRNQTDHEPAHQNLKKVVLSVKIKNRNYKKTNQRQYVGCQALIVPTLPPELGFDIERIWLGCVNSV
ncbi:hypothetical protein ACA545_01880, partial [Vibrio cholerae]|uniref:hypothetical protein n=1 Tax=Vibrio cholerae TaxID=666 RepID=UPI003A0FCDA2